jgi:hypothetical protein
MKGDEPGGTPERENEPVLKWQITCVRPVTLVVTAAASSPAVTRTLPAPHGYPSCSCGVASGVALVEPEN